MRNKFITDNLKIGEKQYFKIGREDITYFEVPIGINSTRTKYNFAYHIYLFDDTIGYILPYIEGVSIKGWYLAESLQQFDVPDNHLWWTKLEDAKEEIYKKLNRTSYMVIKLSVSFYAVFKIHNSNTLNEEFNYLGIWNVRQINRVLNGQVSMNKEWTEYQKIIAFEDTGMEFKN